MNESINQSGSMLWFRCCKKEEEKKGAEGRDRKIMEIHSE